VKQHTVANAATSDISQNLIQTPKSTSLQNLIRKVLSVLYTSDPIPNPHCKCHWWPSL